MKKILYSLGLLASIFWSCETPSTASRDGAPQINDPKVVGNYPGTPFLFAVPTTGDRPIEWQAKGLPTGLSINSKNGFITGQIDEPGTFQVKLFASNAKGIAESDLEIVIGDTLALTPTMGWNSWNTFGQHISDSLIRQTIDSVVATGMRDLGYQYINIDDFWQLVERDENGKIQINKEKFPNGIKAVADYAHANGLKIGIYSDAAELTCGRVAGSFGFEEEDAADFAAWGIDLLKYDYCLAPADKQTAIERYTAMNDALRKQNRSIVFSVCEWGGREPWTWAAEAGGEYWRTTWDIRNTWEADVYDDMHNGVMNILDINSELDEYAGRGRWNDPDMLIVGIGNNQEAIVGDDNHLGCTNLEYQSHMSLWCMMAAPLLSGNDLRNMDEETKRILTNQEIIAINQDVLGKQAKKIKDSGEVEYYLKPLKGGNYALAILNRFDNKSIEEKVSWSDLGIAGTYAVRDVWEHADLGKFEDGIKATVLPHETKVYLFNNTK